MEYIYLGETAIQLDGTNDFLLAAKGLCLRDCSEKQTQTFDVDPNMSNDQNLDSLDSVKKEMTINPTTTRMK